MELEICLHRHGIIIAVYISNCALQMLKRSDVFVRYCDAIDLLKWLLSSFTCDVRRGYWTLRLSIDLEHLGCTDESLQVAENGLVDPWVRAGSRVALQRRVLRLGKPPRRWKVPSFCRSALRKIPEVIALLFYDSMFLVSDLLVEYPVKFIIRFITDLQ